MNYTQKIFLFSLFFSVLIVLSANNWFIAWFGLELNMMSFIPLILKNNKMSSESSMKYFFVQSIASLLILLNCILMAFFVHELLLNPAFIQPLYNLIPLSLYTKMGAAPFHFWFPSTIEGLSWSSAILLMTWQKLAPLSLSFSFSQLKIIFIPLIASALVGTFGGLNQLLLRKLMAYSSINHISWMLFSSFFSESLSILYFSMYSAILISFAMMLLNKNTNHFSQLLHWKFTKKLKSVLLLMILLSLGGLPPFIGFFPKWIVLSCSLSSTLIFISTFLIMLSMITLYFYLRMALSSFMLEYTNIVHQKSYMTNTYFSFFLMSNLVMFPFLLYLY